MELKNRLWVWLAVVVLGLLLCWVGCKKKPPTEPPEEAAKVWIDSLVANPTHIPADTVSTSTIRAYLDTDPSAISEVGLPIHFVASAGSLSLQDVLTDANGVATTVLTAGAEPDTARVTASYLDTTFGPAERTVSVYFIAIGQTYFESLTADPTSMLADSVSTSTITARLVQSGVGPVVGASIDFTTTRGSIDPPVVVTDSAGMAVSILRAGIIPGDAIVVATYSAVVKDTVRVTFYPPEQGMIYVESMEASPEVLIANGISTSDITAVFRYTVGGPADGLPIEFTTTAGSITPSDTTDSLGIARAVLTSGTTTDTALVTAAYGLEAKDSVYVWMVSPEDTVPASIVIDSVSQYFIYVQGSGYNETSTLVFQVRDRRGHPLMWPLMTTFRIDSGPHGGEYVYPDSAMTYLSRGTTHLCSGDSSGAVRVIAAVSGSSIESNAIEITICSGPPHPNHFCVATQKLNLYAWYRTGVPDIITAYVGDLHGNPVPDNTTVWFWTDCGIIFPGYGNTAGGVANNTLISCAPWPELDPGLFYTHAQTIDGNGHAIDDSVRVLWSGGTIVTITPLVFAIPDNGYQDFTYWVYDLNSNPLTEGTTITVEADVGLRQGDINITLPDTQSRNWTQFSFRLLDDDPGDTDPPAVCAVVVKVQSESGNREASAYGTVD